MQRITFTSIYAGATYLDVSLKVFGCVLCQKYHTEGDPEFEPHLFFQSKHGYRSVDVYQAIIEKWAELKFRGPTA